MKTKAAFDDREPRPSRDLGAEVGHVLVVDDDRSVLRSLQNIFVRQGWTVETALDGLDAQAVIKRRSFDVIISDVNMPGYGGLAFLRAVRELDHEVPVILVTGAPSVDSAIRAIEHGVFRYLVKPVANEALVEVTRLAARIHRMNQSNRRALEVAGSNVHSLGDRATVEKRFQRAAETLSVEFQPIVSWRDRRAFGFEAVLRTSESALASPPDFIAAAERLGRRNELARTARAMVAEAARRLPADTKLFVNLHPSDLDDDGLREACAPLSRIAHRVVLVVSERTSLVGATDMSAQITALKGLGFRVAVALGAGYPGLANFTQLEPDVVKLDASLIRNIDKNPRKHCVVGAMKRLCDELGMVAVAEEVETVAEREVLVKLGFDLLQGCLFGRPARAFERPRF